MTPSLPEHLLPLLAPEGSFPPLRLVGSTTEEAYDSLSPAELDSLLLAELTETYEGIRDLSFVAPSPLPFVFYSSSPLLRLAASRISPSLPFSFTVETDPTIPTDCYRLVLDDPSQTGGGPGAMSFLAPALVDRSTYTTHRALGLSPEDALTATRENWSDWPDALTDPLPEEHPLLAEILEAYRTAHSSSFLTVSLLPEVYLALRPHVDRRLYGGVSFRIVGQLPTHGDITLGTGDDALGFFLPLDLTLPQRDLYLQLRLDGAEFTRSLELARLTLPTPSAPPPTSTPSSARVAFVDAYDTHALAISSGRRFDYTTDVIHPDQPRLSSEDAILLRSYLAGATLVCQGPPGDWVEEQLGETHHLSTSGHHFYTDGHYVWDQSLPYYILRYNVAPTDAAFMAHVRSQRICPVPDASTVDAIREELSTPEPVIHTLH